MILAFTYSGTVKGLRDLLDAIELLTGSHDYSMLEFVHDEDDVFYGV